MSPDWAASAEAIPYASFDNPQTFNLYAYVSNDPIDGEDPDGHAEYPSGNGLTDVENQQMGTIFWSQQTPASNGGVTLFAAADGIFLAVPNTFSQNSKDQQKDCGCATGESFKGKNSRTKAAIKALDAIYGRSNKEHTEYGGRIYERADGSYGYTTPVKGGRDENGNPSVDVDAGKPEGTRIPVGTTNAGIYHTHPLIPGYAGEQFSGDDARGAVREQVPNFMEAPSRSIYEINGAGSNNYFTAPQTTLRQGPPTQ